MYDGLLHQYWLARQENGLGHQDGHIPAAGAVPVAVRLELGRHGRGVSRDVSQVSSLRIHAGDRDTRVDRRRRKDNGGWERMGYAQRAGRGA